MKINLKLYFSFLVLLIAIMFVASCQDEPVKKELSQEELIARGEYIVSTSGCHDCHTPKKMTEQGPVPDENYLLAGHPADLPIPEYDKSIIKDWALFNHSLTAAVGPWGVSFSANITSDGTGLGNWTYDQFKTAMTKGLYKGLEGSRPIMPPMPWQEFQNYTDEDLRAIFAYLQSTKPVQNVPPAYIPPDQM